jgi:hypothetical protein
MNKAGIQKFEIDEQIVLASDRCREAYSCLKGVEDCLCSVEDELGGRVLFVTEHNSIACPYKMSYGYSHICSCPVRMEIYKRYSR